MSEIVVDRDSSGEAEQSSQIDSLRNMRVHVLGKGAAAAAVALALEQIGLVELQDFVVLDPQGCEMVEHTNHTHRAPSPRLVAISYGPEGADLTLVTTSGSLLARNIVIANDEIWHKSGLGSEPQASETHTRTSAKLASPGRPVPGLFTVGYPHAARRSEHFTLQAAATRIAALIEQQDEAEKASRRSAD